MLMTLMPRPRPRYRTMRGLGVTAGDEAPLAINQIGPDGINPTAIVDDVLAGAKLWLTPGTAVNEIKAVATGASTRSTAQLAGLAIPVLAAVMIVPSFFKSGRRRR